MSVIEHRVTACAYVLVFCGVDSRTLVLYEVYMNTQCDLGDGFQYIWTWYIYIIATLNNDICIWGKVYGPYFTRVRVVNITLLGRSRSLLGQQRSANNRRGFAVEPA